MHAAGRILWGAGCGLLIAAGFVGASTLTQRTAAAVPPDSFDIKPSWTPRASDVRAGSSFVATLAPNTAKRCDVTISGPRKSDAVRWTIQANGMPIRLTLPTERAATPGRWTVLASCIQRYGARRLTARMTLDLLGSGGRHPLAQEGALRRFVIRPHPQALGGSETGASVKVARIAVTYGKSRATGDDYPAPWRTRRDSVLDVWGNYNRECTSFVAWALASRNGFSMPFHANAIAWAAQARARGYRVDRNPTAGSVAYWGVGPGHVAYVQSVSGNAVQVEDYGWFGHAGRFDSRTVPASAFTSFIHFKDLKTLRPNATPTTLTGTTGQPTGGSQNTGGSSATCSPWPCTSGAVVEHMLTAPDSDGTDAKNATFTYLIRRPVGLANSPSNLAPLLVLYDQPGLDDANLIAASNTDRFVILYIPPSHLIGGVDQYADPVVSPTPVAQAPKTCGTDGANVCDDIPGLNMVLRQVVCSGAVPCENIDPNRVYAAGASKGALMTMAGICDTRTSSYFHAAWVVSWLLTSPAANSQTAAANCPAILGTSMAWSGGFWGGTAGLGANTNISIGFEGGDADSFACTAGLPSTCLDTGGYDLKNRWWWSVWQMAGDSNPPSPGSSAGSGVMFGARLGCSHSPSTNMRYGIGNQLHETTYTGCARPNRATLALMVHTGGHAWPGLDGKGGLDSATEAWNFFTRYGGP